jgi:copper chaperone NosL
MALFAAGCNRGPEDIRFDLDTCVYCEMKISDRRFPAELITAKGKALKFDDAACMLAELRANSALNEKGGRVFVASFTGAGEWLDAGTATYVVGGGIKSPMDGNCAALKDEAAAERLAMEMKGKIADWNALQTIIVMKQQ